jgi:hypothetical protein
MIYERACLNKFMAVNGTWNDALVTLIASNLSRKQLGSTCSNFEEIILLMTVMYAKCHAQKWLAA